MAGTTLNLARTALNDLQCVQKHVVQAVSAAADLFRTADLESLDVHKAAAALARASLAADDALLILHDFFRTASALEKEIVDAVRTADPGRPEGPGKTV